MHLIEVVVAAATPAKAATPPASGHEASSASGAAKASTATKATATASSKARLLVREDLWLCRLDLQEHNLSEPVVS